MNDKQEKAILQFLCDICKTLCLDEWTIQMGQRQVENQDAMAEVEVTPYRRIATVYLVHDFLDFGHRDILHTLVHEMLHLYFADIKQTIEDLSEFHVLGNEAHSVLQLTMRRHEEISVDQMAKAWSALMWEWESVHKHLRRITPKVERTAR